MAGADQPGVGPPTDLDEQPRDRLAAVIADRLPACVARLAAATTTGQLDLAWQAAERLAELPLDGPQERQLQAARDAARSQFAARLDALLAAAAVGRVLEHESAWRALTGLRSAGLAAVLDRLLGDRELPGLSGAIPSGGPAPGHDETAGLVWSPGRSVRVRWREAVVEARVLGALGGGRVAVKIAVAGGGFRAPAVPAESVEPQRFEAAEALQLAEALLLMPSERGRAVAWLWAGRQAGASRDAWESVAARFPR